MTFRHFVTIGSILVFSVLLSSCVKDSDFDQEEARKTLPVIQSNLAISSLRASDFLIDNTKNEVLFLSDTIDVSFVTSDYIQRQFKKAELSFDLTNSIDRDFLINFEFLSDADEVKYTIKVPISSGSLEKPIGVEINAIVKEPELAGLKDAIKLVYKISLPSNGSGIHSDSSGTIELTSIATLFLEL